MRCFARFGIFERRLKPNQIVGLTIIASVTILVTVMAANSQFAIAVHILTVLAKAGEDKNVKSDYIAESVKTNPVVIRRLLADLNRAKLVVSQTGANGGTRLAKCPHQLNLADVHRAVSCGVTFALRRETNDDCAIGKNIQCVLEKLQTEISETVEAKLAQFSLQSVLEAVETVGCENGRILN